MLQAALNGSRTKVAHREVPVTVTELVRDALAAKRAGARELHIHPRDERGEQTLDPLIVDATVAEVHRASGLPVGVSTGAWIEPDPRRRYELVSQWTQPAYASVNLAEPGATDIMGALTKAGIGIEAGIWSADDAGALARSGHGGSVLRVLVEVIDPSPVGALARAAKIHDALTVNGIAAPRLQHGYGDATWVLIRDATERGLDTRIGFEDTLTGPRGGVPKDNADLVEEAQAVIGRALLRAA